MKPTAYGNNILLGIVLAVAATIIWSGNFIVARAIIKDIPPITLAFYRWLTAVVILIPFAWNHILPAWAIVKQNKAYFFWTALTGVSLFNTFVYIAGHSSTAINLALIGTTSSPIISVILAHFFLKEHIKWRRVVGILLCISGILFLLSKGSFQNLFHLQFNKGDAWVLLGALSFAVVSQPDSAIASLDISQLSGIRSDGRQVGQTAVNPGRVFIVINEPILEIEASGFSQIRVYRIPGHTATLLWADPAVNPWVWTRLTDFVARPFKTVDIIADPSFTAGRVYRATIPRLP